MNALFPDCTIHHMLQRSPEWHEIRKDKLTATGMGAWLAEEPQVRITVDEIKVILDRFAIPYFKSAAKPVLLALLPPEMLPRPSILQESRKARHAAICRILGSMSKAQCPDPFDMPTAPEGYEDQMHKAAWGIICARSGSEEEAKAAEDEFDYALSCFPPPPRNASQWPIWNGVRLEPVARAAFEHFSGKEIVEVGFCVHKSGSAGCSPDGLIAGEPVGFEGKCPLPTAHCRYLLDGVLPDEYRDQVHGSMAVTGAQGWWFQSYCPGLPSFRIYVERDEYADRMASGLDEFAVHLKSAREEISDLWDAEFSENAIVVAPATLEPESTSDVVAG